jgi:hypothetical protein
MSPRWSRLLTKMLHAFCLLLHSVKFNTNIQNDGTFLMNYSASVSLLRTFYLEKQLKAIKHHFGFRPRPKVVLGLFKGLSLSTRFVAEWEITWLFEWEGLDRKESWPTLSFYPRKYWRRQFGQYASRTRTRNNVTQGTEDMLIWWNYIISKTIPVSTVHIFLRSQLLHWKSVLLLHINNYLHTTGFVIFG